MEKEGGREYGEEEGGSMGRRRDGEEWRRDRETDRDRNRWITIHNLNSEVHRQAACNF